MLDMLHAPGPNLVRRFSHQQQVPSTWASLCCRTEAQGYLSMQKAAESVEVAMSPWAWIESCFAVFLAIDKSFRLGASLVGLSGLRASCASKKQANLSRLGMSLYRLD
jgi:hypothetical protein